MARLSFSIQNEFTKRVESGGLDNKGITFPSVISLCKFAKFLHLGEEYGMTYYLCGKDSLTTKWTQAIELMSKTVRDLIDDMGILDENTLFACFSACLVFNKMDPFAYFTKTVCKTLFSFNQKFGELYLRLSSILEEAITYPEIGEQFYCKKQEQAFLVIIKWGGLCDVESVDTIFGRQKYECPLIPAGANGRFYIEGTQLNIQYKAMVNGTYSFVIE